MTSAKIARRTEAAIVHAKMETISDPPGYFATVPEHHRRVRRVEV